MRVKKNQKRSIGRHGLRSNGRRNYWRNSLAVKAASPAQSNKTHLKLLPEIKSGIRADVNPNVQTGAVKRTLLKLVPVQREAAAEKASPLSESPTGNAGHGSAGDGTGSGGNDGDGGSRWNSPRVTGLVAAVLLLSMLALGAWSSVGSARASDEALDVRAGAQTASLQLAKEYIYAGSRMLAIEVY